MTFGEAMMHLLLAFYGTFMLVAFAGITLGGVLGWWLRGARNNKPVPARDDAWLEQVLDEPIYAAGVARVGEP